MLGEGLGNGIPKAKLTVDFCRQAGAPTAQRIVSPSSDKNLLAFPGDPGPPYLIA